MANGCYQNLSSFFQYAVCTHLIRLLCVALPMLFGSAALNARHILLCSFVIDLVSLTLFWQRKEYARHRAPKYQRFGDYLSTHKDMWIASVSAALTLVLLPRLMDFLAWIGPYYFQTEFSFCAILYLHLTVLFAFLIGKKQSLKDLLCEKGFLLLCAGTVLFLILSFVIEPIGRLFDLLQNPLGYALLAFVPSLVFAVVYYLLKAKKRKGKS